MRSSRGSSIDGRARGGLLVPARRRGAGGLFLFLLLAPPSLRVSLDGSAFCDGKCGVRCSKASRHDDCLKYCGIFVDGERTSGAGLSSTDGACPGGARGAAPPPAELTELLHHTLRRHRWMDPSVPSGFTSADNHKFRKPLACYKQFGNERK